LNHAIKSDEDGQLQEHRQTAPERADFVFLPDFHDLALGLHRVVLVFFLDGFDLGLEGLHALHRACAGLSERPEEELDDDGDRDDGGGVGQSQRVQAVHRNQQRLGKEAGEKTAVAHHRFEIVVELQTDFVDSAVFLWPGVDREGAFDCLARRQRRGFRYVHRGRRAAG